MIDLYTWTTPNGRKVSIALEELGLPCLVLRASQAKVLLSARVKPNRFDPLYEVGNRSTAFITIVPFLKGNDQARAVTSGLCAPVRSAEGKLVRRGGGVILSSLECNPVAKASLWGATLAIKRGHAHGLDPDQC